MAEASQPPEAPVEPQRVTPLPLKPHRGAVVLVLGILGIVVCFICGIIAWVMANRDLAEMTAGQMDPAGRGMTTAGKICGIVGVCFWSAYYLVWFIYMCFFLIFAVAAMIAATTAGGQ